MIFTTEREMPTESIPGDVNGNIAKSNESLKEDKGLIKHYDETGIPIE